MASRRYPSMKRGNSVLISFLMLLSFPVGAATTVGHLEVPTPVLLRSLLLPIGVKDGVVVDDL